MADLVHVGTPAAGTVCGESHLLVVKLTQNPLDTTCPKCAMAMAAQLHSQLAQVLGHLAGLLGMSAAPTAAPFAVKKGGKQS